MPARRIWLRALFVAAAIVLLVATIPVVLSGFLPDAPTLRNLSRLIVPFLPLVDLLAVAGAAASLAALRIRAGSGGGGLTRGILGLSVAVLVGAIVMTGRVLAFSAANGAPISVARAIGLSSSPAPKADETVTFATVEGRPLQAQVWLPPNPSDGPPVAARAVAMYVHGGSFTGGGLGDRPRLFRSLAEGRVVVVEIEYRLAPPPRWDQAPGDVLCALGWLEAHAAELGGDPHRIVVIGDSAGGNLAMLASYAAGGAGLASSCDLPASPPAAVIAMEPAADLAAIWADHSIGGDASGPFPESYIGGPPSQYPDRYAAASPLRLLRSGLPATLLVAGEIDHLIRPARTADLARQLHAAGVSCSILTVPYAEHGIAAGPDDYAAQLLESIIPGFTTAVLDSDGGYGPACQ